jgi:sulfite dehydrogenase (cytochrome) subunit A
MDEHAMKMALSKASGDVPRQLGRRPFLHKLGAASIVGAGAMMGVWGDEAFSASQQAPAGGAQTPPVVPEDPILSGRPLVQYPEKADLILLTSRPPQLETPMRYFDRAITPNEAFFVRYHVFPIPTSVDPATWRLKITGHIERPLELSMGDLVSKFPEARIFAVNQCSGNGRGYFEPRVLGGQWSNGAMGNAQWIGARMRDILTAVGVKAGAVDVTFNGLDQSAAPSVPDFVKSLSVTQIMENPDILIAYRMNGEPLPMLNGFPARLVVPGWYSTYWVKNLAEITVLDHEFDGFWMQKAYRIPDTPCACLEPGATPARTVPITRMNVRSFIASPADGSTVPARQPVTLKGIAFDGGYGISQVEISSDRGATWRRAQLGRDLGPYSFREWSANWTLSRPGNYRVMVRAINRMGESQPFEPRWNPAGYMRNVIEHIDLHVA